MTVLVTGVTGLVGARLLPRLVQSGIDCRALVRGDRPPARDVEAATGDLLDPSSLETAVRGVSAVIHLAAVFRTTDADLIWKANLEGTRNLIDATKAFAPDARFILASTGHVYEAGSHPGREDDSVNPKQAYPASKVAAEEALRTSGLKWAVVRLPFVYGDRDGHLESLPKLVAQGAVQFHPAQRMSLIHHQDIATAMALALGGALDGQTVNIADEAPTSLYELFQIVGETMESSDAPLSNPWHLHLDASRARRLGFVPVIRTVYQAAQEGLL